MGRKVSTIPQYKEKSGENFVRTMLIIDDWKADCGREATVNALIRACDECGIHRDSIEAAYKDTLKS